MLSAAAEAQVKGAALTLDPTLAPTLTLTLTPTIALTLTLTLTLTLNQVKGAADAAQRHAKAEHEYAAQ